VKLTNFMASIIAVVAMISTSVLAQDAVSTEATEIAVVSQKGKDGADCDTNGCDSKGCSCYLFGPDEPFTLFPGGGAISITGHTQIGYHNQQTPLSAAPGDGGAFNDLPDRLNVHQQWFTVERALNTDKGGWDWGFRMDFVYGTDAQKTQAFGTGAAGWDTPWDNGDYGWALPQLYAEIGNGNLTVKAGHFYTLAGYEVVAATGNFFYSHALTMFNAEPFTHTGVLATLEGDLMTVHGGWTEGWDTGFDNSAGGSSFLGGVNLNLTDNITLSYIATGGDLGNGRTDGYSHSLIADVQLNDRLNYVFQNDYLNIGGTGDEVKDITQYLFYTVGDCLAVGGRLEWFNDGTSDRWEGTFGVNYRPHANMVLRPEVRKDWVEGVPAADLTTFGIDMVLSY